MIKTVKINNKYSKLNIENLKIKWQNTQKLCMY